ncbi:tetratricopeptide repeat protein [Desulfovibrio sp. SGI.169]|uniref:tetratricopeptide repeat protein n=1 Tax=Desulfovibrio sp. SGI.169 TaxID=3420561 RepID=UPI003CFD7DBC
MRPPKYLGVYSQPLTKADGPRKMFFFVWELAEGDYAVQRLDSAFQPREKARRVSAARFAAYFRAESAILAMPMTMLDVRALAGFSAAPAPAAPASRIPKVDDILLRRLENARRAKQTEVTLRENFRKALLRLKRPRERQAAIAALEQMATATENISPVHKHMFRDFGAKLRKTAMPDLALLFGRRALDLAPEDDHAHFNLARILCALGAYDEAAEHIRTAMRLDAREAIYPRMLAHIRKEKQLRLGTNRPRQRR